MPDSAPAAASNDVADVVFEAVPGSAPDIAWPPPTGPSQRLLDAAVDAFAQKGFHATTTRDIAARVGMSPAALYVHYPSKAALLARISLGGHEHAVRLVERELASSPDLVQSLRTMISSFTAWHARNHLMARVVQYELASLPPGDRATVVALRRRIEGMVEQHVAAGVEADVMEVADCHRVARALLSLAVDVARWYDPAGRDSPEGIGALYADLATRMVRAGP